MRNRKKEQEAKDKIVRIKAIIKTNENSLLNAYSDYYFALGYSAKEVARLIK